MTNFPSTSAISSANDSSPFEDLLNAVKQLPGGNDISELTISSGTVTPTTGIHTIDTEADAATDDLTNILTTNLPAGSLLILSAADAARTVVVKHNAGGAGQISLSGGEDFSLDDDEKVLIVSRRGANWVEVGRFEGSVVIEDNSVTTAKLVDGAVTTAKIAGNAVDGTKIALGSDAQGDIMYYNGTDWVRLAAGTSGQFLKTNGAAANPAWAASAGGLGQEAGDNMILNTFRIGKNGSLSVQKMVDGVVDGFVDETGVGSATNETYDAGGDYYLYSGVDANWADVSLLLPFNGNDAETTTTDLSDTGHAITFVETAQIDTAEGKFGGSSLLLDGDSDYVEAADHADWVLGSGDFTIECHAMFNSISGTDKAFCGQWSTNRAFFWNYDVSASKMHFQYTTTGSGAGTEISQSNTWTPVLHATTPTWYHLAIVRNGSNLHFFVDGVEQGTTSTAIGSDSIADSTEKFVVGAYDSVYPSGSYFDGWIDNFRLTVGTARYTSNFTPPTVEYGTSSSTGMTLISEAQTAEAQPDDAHIILFEEDVDAVTINTDLKAYASRDGGTTWTQATLSDQGDYESGKRILTGDADISGQPSGTSMKWKVETLNSKKLRAHGVSLQWS